MKYTNLGKTDIRVSRIPYSPLAGGHLSHRGWESGTKRSDTNAKHFDDAVKAVDLVLSDEDVAFVEAPYKAHEIVGAVNANMTL